MKKLIIIFIIFSGLFYAQNNPRPGVDYLPHIGFFDFVVNALSHPWDSSSTNIIPNYQAKGWYFDKIKELGLTNLVTDGQYNLTIHDTINNTFFLNDMGFQWKNKTWANPPVIFKPAEYLNSLGHDWLRYPLEFGGSIAGSISGANNFGFTTAGGSNTCYWGMQGTYQPAYDATGDNVDEYVNTTLHYSRYAKVNLHDEGVMLWGVLPWTQVADPSLKYRMRIYLRIADEPEKDMDVFTINLSNWTGETDDPQLEHKRDYFYQPDAQTESTGLTQVVKTTDIPDSTGYIWFESEEFSVSQDMNLGFNIYWHDNASIYIDKITFVSAQFKEIFVDSSITIDTIAYTLFNTYNDLTNPRFQSFYADEPFQLSALYRKELQTKIYQKAATVNPTLELNGATGGVPAYFLEFERKWAKPDGDEAKRSIIYNIYPIAANTTYEQASIQDRLDLLVSYGNFGTSYDYQFSGLKRAQKAAQNFTLNEDSDDIPLIFTMGVHSEQYVTGSANAPVYISGAHERRAPTWSEIFAQGNLALAYGAKGFMYYMIPTRAKPPVPNTYKDTVWNTYGLFDSENEVYDTLQSTMSGSFQNPLANQIPNSRFYAVKSFISSISPIETTLLGLRWEDAKSWHNNSSCTVDWISNIATRYPHFPGNDGSSARYVETGYFNEINPPSGKVEDAKFVYLVNRRCNIQSPYSPSNPYAINDTSYRNITLTLNFPNSTWDYYTVIDLKTDSVYFTTKTGDVTIFLGAGEGTLLKIEPQITSITQNDTLGYNTTFYSDLTVSNNATLTITEGTTLTFENHSRLILSNGNLTVNATAEEPVVFDFVTPYWQSTTNGIVNNYGSVVLNHAKIKNAAVGYYSYSTDNDDIQNSEIFNNQWGIVMHWTHSYGTEKAKIINCNIHDNSTWDNQGRGITLSNSSPKIYATTIRKNDYGLYCTTNSNPHDTIEEANGYNIIDSNDVGVISYYSTPMLGFVEDEQGDIFYLGGGNTIKDNSLFNVKSYDNSNVYVERDYWGTKDTSLFNIYSDSTSSIYTDYCLDDPPSGSIQSGLASKTTMKIDAEWMPPSQANFTSGGQSNLLRAALKQIRHGNMTAARAILLPLLNNPENMQLSCGALELYGKTYNPEDIESFFSVLLTVGNRPVKNDLTAKALFLLSEYQTDRKETHLTNLISVYQGTDHAARASYLKIVHLIGEGNPMEEIYALKNDMNRLYPLSSYTKEVNYLLVSGTNMMKPSTSASTTETLPLEYNLLNNYPNPFNPETMIKFSLKERSNVTLEVYNIAGQKVAELVTGEMEKGFYEKRFNGTKLSSGVYIFRLNAQSLESTTFYTKTMKALLLK